METYTSILQVKLEGQAKERMDALCKQCELPADENGYKLVVSNAIRLFENVIAQSEQGNTFLIKKPDGSTEEYKVFG